MASDSIDRKLSDMGVARVKYYYKNNPLIGNIFTVCIFFDEDNEPLSRGVAICSLMDTHNKKIARKLSFSRAIKALFNKKNNEKISEEPAGIFECHYVKRFKIKSDENLVNLEIMAENFGFDTNIVVLENNIRRLDVYIPYNFCITETYTLFLFKSEYLPSLTDEEKTMFSKIIK